MFQYINQVFTMIRNLDKVFMVRNGEFLAFGIMNTIVG